MKRIYIYRFVSLFLIFALLFSYIMYKNKKVINVEKKEILNPNYVFLGDSITDFYDLDKYYPKIKKVNSGISGNQTDDILKDMYNRVYKYNPSKVFLLIGINDIIHVEDSNYVANDIEEIASEIHKNLPECEIYIESIYPINEECGKRFRIVADYVTLNEKVVKENERIKQLCKKKNYNYIDIYSLLIDKRNNLDKKYSDDGLHLNGDGYNKVTKKIKEFM